MHTAIIAEFKGIGGHLQKFSDTDELSVAYFVIGIKRNNLCLVLDAGFFFLIRPPPGLLPVLGPKMLDLRVTFLIFFFF